MTPPINASDLARAIDHTLLKRDATQSAFAGLADEAIEHGFFAVCVPPARIPVIRTRLEGTRVLIASVAGFPHGNTLPDAKADEAALAAEAGAREIDMVINIGALKDGDHTDVAGDIERVVGAARAHGATVKVIIETALLTDDEKRDACRLAAETGAAFVKTSTGFAGGGATADDVRLMRSVVGDRLGVKASGGIRTLADAHAMLEAGASRLGCSSSVAIVNEARSER